MWPVLASVVLTCTAPTFNTDGTPLTDLTSYDVLSGCTASSVYERPIEVFQGAACGFTIENLPDSGTCYFAARAINSSGVASFPSNEAVKFLGALQVPGPVLDTAITWEPQSVAIAFDNVSEATGGTGNLTWNHDPIGTPRGVIVFIAQQDEPFGVTGVTYGGTAMTEVTGSPINRIDGEDAAAYAFFLGASVPTDDPAEIIVSTDVADAREAMAVTVTAAQDTEVVATDVTLNSSGDNNPSATLALGGATSFVAEGFFSGSSTESSSTARTNWTKRFGMENFINASSGFMTYDIIGSTDVTVGYVNAASEDVTLIAVAIKESAAGGTTSKLVVLNRNRGR